MRHLRIRFLPRAAVGLAIIATLFTAATVAQDRLKTMPGYAQYERMSREIPSAVKSGALGDHLEGSATFEYMRDGKRYRYDVATKSATEVSRDRDGGQLSPGADEGARRRAAAKSTSAESPDGKLKAFYRDRNLWLSDAAGGNETAITTDGSEKDAIKYGTASWVYGEELSQTTAMWWSPDSTKIAYYRFDEQKVPDYFLQMDQTKMQSTRRYRSVSESRRAKPDGRSVRVRRGHEDSRRGSTCATESRSTTPSSATTSTTSPGRPMAPSCSSIAPTAARTSWNSLPPIRRPARRRVIVREEWPTGWIENNPTMHVPQGRQALHLGIVSETAGRILYLYDLSGSLIAPLTTHTTFEVGSLVKIDEAAGVMFYTARDGDNYLKLQLHRVGLDGKGERAPDRSGVPSQRRQVYAAGARPRPPSGWRSQAAAASRPTTSISSTSIRRTTCRRPPASSMRRPARSVAELAESDLTKFAALGLKKAEMFTYKAADGKTTLHGTIQFPSTFDPAKKYPVLVERLRRAGVGEQHRARDVHHAERDRPSTAFSCVNLDSRAAPGQGKRVARRDLPEARAGRDRRHGGRGQGAVEPSVRRSRRGSEFTGRRTAAMPR